MFFVYLYRLINNELFVKFSGLNVTSLLAAIGSMETTREKLSLVLIIISIVAQLLGILVVLLKLKKEERNKE